MIQYVPLPTAGVDSQYHRSPSDRPTFPPHAVSEASGYPPSQECPRATGTTTSAKCLCQSLIFSFSLKVTIGGLSEEVLLIIFCYYLDTSPRLWPRLAHICRRWRRVVFVFQRTLRLRLFCTYGTPVVKSLDCWPTLPIVVWYGGITRT